MKKSAMNIPNTLSIIRVVLVPAFVGAMIFMRDIAIWGQVIPALIYALTALTDMLDGKIARKYNLVTDFGKFIDPLADKFMVIGSQIAILTTMLLVADSAADVAWCIIFTFLVLVILLRELGVTSLRLVVAGKSGIVVAASMLGKMKTVSQMVGTVVIILEPLIPVVSENHILSYICMAVMAFTTIFSGLDYLKAYMPYVDTNK